MNAISNGLTMQQMKQLIWLLCLLLVGMAILSIVIPVLAQTNAPEAMTPTIPPVNDGAGGSFDPYSLIDRLVNWMIVFVGFVLALAGWFGFQVHNSVPRRALPFINLGQKAAERLTPGDDWDNQKIRDLATKIGLVPETQPDGSTIWKEPVQMVSHEDAWSPDTAQLYLEARGYHIVPPRESLDPGSIDDVAHG